MTDGNTAFLTSLAVAVISGVLTTVFGVVLFSLKYAVSQRDKEIDRRLDTGETASLKHDKEIEINKERLHIEEKKSVEIDGKLKLVDQTHNTFSCDLDEIKKSIVPRQEWESRMTSIDRTLEKILTRIEPSRYSQQMGRVVPEEKIPR